MFVGSRRVACRFATATMRILRFPDDQLLKVYADFVPDCDVHIFASAPFTIQMLGERVY